MIKKLFYIIDWGVLFLWNLPSFLRKPKQIAWIKAFTKPINDFYQSKQLWRESIRYRLAHSGEVIYLEKVLNEYFEIADYDPKDHNATKKIYIGEGDEIFPIWLAIQQEEELQWLALDSEEAPLYTPTTQEVSAFASFTIFYPGNLTLSEIEMSALVKYYIDTKQFTIKKYTL